MVIIYLSAKLTLIAVIKIEFNNTKVLAVLYHLLSRGESKFISL